MIRIKRLCLEYRLIKVTVEKMISFQPSSHTISDEENSIFCISELPVFPMCFWPTIFISTRCTNRILYHQYILRFFCFLEGFLALVWVLWFAIHYFNVGESIISYNKIFPKKSRKYDTERTTIFKRSIKRTLVQR